MSSAEEVGYQLQTVKQLERKIAIMLVNRMPGIEWEGHDQFRVVLEPVLHALNYKFSTFQKNMQIANFMQIGREKKRNPTRVFMHKSPELFNRSTVEDIANGEYEGRDIIFKRVNSAQAEREKSAGERSRSATPESEDDRSAPRTPTRATRPRFERNYREEDEDVTAEEVAEMVEEQQESEDMEEEVIEGEAAPAEAEDSSFHNTFGHMATVVLAHHHDERGFGHDECEPSPRLAEHHAEVPYFEGYFSGAHHDGYSPESGCLGDEVDNTPPLHRDLRRHQVSLEHGVYQAASAPQCAEGPCAQQTNEQRLASFCEFLDKPFISVCGKRGRESDEVDDFLEFYRSSKRSCASDWRGDVPLSSLFISPGLIAAC